MLQHKQIPQIVHETIPYDGMILKGLFVVGFLIALWTIFEEGAS